MILCFDIGGARIRAALADGDQITLLGESATPTTDLAAFLAAMTEFRRAGVTQVAVSIAGVIGPICQIANIQCLNGRDVRGLIAAAFGLPVTLVNDADAFALAEARRGAGRGHARVFAIILGSGIGGGIVLDGRLMAGAGEWGHGPVITEPALICGCGQVGCLETIGSARGLERLAGNGQRAEDIVADWARTGTHPAVTRWLDLLSGPLAMLINLLNADSVPVGGGLSNAPRLIAALDVAVRAKILRDTDHPIVVCAKISADAGLVGAAIAAQTGQD